MTYPSLRNDSLLAGSLLLLLALMPPATAQWEQTAREIDRATRDFEKVLQSSGIIGAEKQTRSCWRGNKPNNVPYSVIYCAAFDYAGVHAELGMTTLFPQITPLPYFRLDQWTKRLDAALRARGKNAAERKALIKFIADVTAERLEHPRLYSEEN